MAEGNATCSERRILLVSPVGRRTECVPDPLCLALNAIRALQAHTCWRVADREHARTHMMPQIIGPAPVPRSTIVAPISSSSML
jgi:hypothetical protein